MSPSVQKLLTPGNARPEFPRGAYLVLCFSLCMWLQSLRSSTVMASKFHQYADDTQLYTTVKSEDVANLQALVDCVRVVTDWFLINDLQLNADKTKAIRFWTRQQLAKHREKANCTWLAATSNTTLQSRFSEFNLTQLFQWLLTSTPW